MIVKKLYESNAQSINKEDKLTKKEYETIFKVFLNIHILGNLRMV